MSYALLLKPDSPQARVHRSSSDTRSLLSLNYSLPKCSFIQLKQTGAIREYGRSNLLYLLNQLPMELMEFWADISGDEFPGIPKDPWFFVQASSGLISYLKSVVLAQTKPTILPSKAVRSVWEAWLKLDKVSLEKFCAANFNIEIADVRTGDFKVNIGESLIVTYVINCVLDGVDFASGKVPDLFTLDFRLKMPSGKLWCADTCYSY